MKKDIGLVSMVFLMGILMLGVGTKAFAEVNLGVNANAGIRADMKANLDQMKAERETFRQKLMTEKEDFRKDIAQRRSVFRERAQKMLTERFDMAVKVLESFQARIQSRIDKQKAEGKDTTAAQASLDAAKIKLTEAKAKIAEVKALIPDSDVKVTADIFANIKLGARDAKDLLKEVHQDMVTAITSLKANNDDNQGDDN